MLGTMDCDMRRFKLYLLTNSCSPFINRVAPANTRQTSSSDIRSLSCPSICKLQMTKGLFISLCTENCPVGSLGSLDVMWHAIAMPSVQTPSRTTRDKQKEEAWSVSSTALRWRRMVYVTISEANQYKWKSCFIGTRGDKWRDSKSL